MALQLYDAQTKPVEIQTFGLLQKVVDTSKLTVTFKDAAWYSTFFE
jgi:hypothetical protein